MFLLVKRRLVICGALLVLFATEAFGDGRYSRTIDGKTLVWNENPQPRDAAAWSGGRDADGYATGQGTVTWFTTTPKFTTGSNIPENSYRKVVTQYTGNMVRGKLEGLVMRVDADGKTFHANLVAGRRGKEWASGLPPVQTAASVAANEQRSNEPAPQQASVVEKQPPAEGPPPAVVNQPPPKPAPETTVTKTPVSKRDDSRPSGDGRYDRTKDGKTLVWNNNPQPGDAATWSGGRDADGYATGQGTVRWFTTSPEFTTGSNIPKKRDIELTRHTGEMVRGKLEGLIARGDADGRASHGKLVAGRRGKKWVAEIPPAQTAQSVAANENRPNEPAQQQASVVEKEPPAEGPPPAEEPPPPAVVSQPPSTPAPEATVAETPVADMDDSLRALVGSSSALRTEAPSPESSIPPTASSSSSGPRLTTAEVTELAEVEARGDGYDLSDYERSPVNYSAGDETWSVSYAHRSANGVIKHFRISVEDKTKKTSIVTAR